MVEGVAKEGEIGDALAMQVLPARGGVRQGVPAVGGDTLFSGGPGATGRSYSDFPTIIGSIRDKLFALPAETKVHTGHGDGTTIGTEAPHLEEWIRAGS